MKPQPRAAGTGKGGNAVILGSRANYSVSFCHYLTSVDCTANSEGPRKSSENGDYLWKCPDLQLEPQLSPAKLPDSSKPFPASLSLSQGVSSHAPLSFPWMTPQSPAVFHSCLKPGIPLSASVPPTLPPFP